VQEVFPAAEGAAAAESADDMMLLSFEEFKAIMEDYDVSSLGHRTGAQGSCKGHGKDRRSHLSTAVHRAVAELGRMAVQSHPLKMLRVATAAA
jgi:hypothetical protein